MKSMTSSNETSTETSTPETSQDDPRTRAEPHYTETGEYIGYFDPVNDEFFPDE